MAKRRDGGGNHHVTTALTRRPMQELAVGRYLLLWLLGVPIPILFLIWAFGGLH